MFTEASTTINGSTQTLSRISLDEKKGILRGSGTSSTGEVNTLTQTTSHSESKENGVPSERHLIRFDLDVNPGEGGAPFRHSVYLVAVLPKGARRDAEMTVSLAALINTILTLGTGSTRGAIRLTNGEV